MTVYYILYIVISVTYIYSNIIYSNFWRILKVGNGK